MNVRFFQQQSGELYQFKKKRFNLQSFNTMFQKKKLITICLLFLFSVSMIAEQISAITISTNRPAQNKTPKHINGPSKYQNIKYLQANQQIQADKNAIRLQTENYRQNIENDLKNQATKNNKNIYQKLKIQTNTVSQRNDFKSQRLASNNLRILQQQEQQDSINQEESYDMEQISPRSDLTATQDQQEINNSNSEGDDQQQEIKDEKNSQTIKTGKTSKKLQQFPFLNLGKRKIFDCFPYNGQNHLLNLRFQVMDSFVDYYVISEGTYTYTGQKKELIFDLGQFSKYAHKILYIPVDNYPKTGKNLTNEDHWENNHYHRNSASRMLKKYASNEDIILISDIDEILSKQGLAQYRPELYPWAATEMRLYYYYFNRLSVYDNKGIQEITNYWVFGMKLTTYKVIKQKFNNELIPLRRGFGCRDDPISRLKYDPLVNCDCLVLRNAGWHFSYVMNDADLLKKLRSIADAVPDREIPDFAVQRTVSPSPLAYLKDVQLEDSGLPIELVRNLQLNKQKSIYAPYFVKVVPNQQCKEGYVEKSASINKKKSRIVLNTRDEANEFKTNKTLKPIQCIKIENYDQQRKAIEDDSLQQKIQEISQQNGEEDNIMPKIKESLKAQQSSAQTASTLNQIEQIKQQQTLKHPQKHESEQKIEKQAALSSVPSQIKSEQEGLFNIIFLTLNFYVVVICLISWACCKKVQNRHIVRQLDTSREDESNRCFNSELQGHKIDQGANISLTS